MGFARIDFTALSTIDSDNYFISTTLDSVNKTDCCTCFKMMWANGSFDRFAVAMAINSNITTRKRDLEKLNLDTLGKIKANVAKLSQKFSKVGVANRTDTDSICEDAFRAAIGALDAVLTRLRQHSQQTRAGVHKPIVPVQHAPSIARLGNPPAAKYVYEESQNGAIVAPPPAHGYSHQLV